MILDITIPGPPVAQGRMKFVKATGHTYDPAKSVAWKNWARLCMRQEIAQGTAGAMVGRIFIPEGPVGIILTVCFACTVTDAKKKLFRDGGIRWHIKKPDLDNVLKAVKDAAKGILWTDDSQVCSILTTKIILPPGEAPFVRLKVYPIEGEPVVNDGQVAIV